MISMKNLSQVLGPTIAQKLHLLKYCRLVKNDISQLDQIKCLDYLS